MRFKINFNIILPSTSRSSKQSPHFSLFPSKPSTHVSSFTCYVSRSSHSPQFDHPDNVWRGIHVIQCLSIQFSSTIFTPVNLGLNIHLSNLLSRTLSLLFPLDVKDKVSHQYTRTKAKL